jgi:3-methyladenine DNA glycosylase AlkD
MNFDDIIKNIKLLYDPHNVEGMARYGINPRDNYGVSIKDLRLMAKRIGRDHGLAVRLWASGIRDARLLATLVAEPGELTSEEAEEMVKGIDSWDVCDGFCMNLVRHTDFAYSKAVEWSSRGPEFEKRAAFSLMSTLAVSDKEASDSKFEEFLQLIEIASMDERNYVRKAVNWALRSIGKRNPQLNKKALKIARKLARSGNASARWVGRDAVKELESGPVRLRLARKQQKRI